MMKTDRIEQQKPSAPPENLEAARAHNQSAPKRCKVCANRRFSPLGRRSDGVLVFRCSVCGAEVVMTAAQSGTEIDAPRHCREDMVLVDD